MAFLFIMENEIWKPIEGFEYYKVSNFGNIKSLRFNKEKILKLNLSDSNYYTVNLFKNKKSYSFFVHKLVSIAFLNHIPCGYKLVINHKDFNKLNNHIDNLEIVTTRENTNLKHIKSSSKYTGVTWYKSSKKWLSSIWINGKRVHLGYFNNEYEAHLAYQNKLKEIL